VRVLSPLLSQRTLHPFLGSSHEDDSTDHKRTQQLVSHMNYDARGRSHTHSVATEISAAAAADRSFQRRAPEPQARFPSLGGPALTPLERLRVACVRLSRYSWWLQVVLASVATVTLLFANSVTVAASYLVIIGRFLTVGGLACSAASALHTLGYARLARRFARTQPSAAEAGAAVAKKLGFGVGLNLSGLALCLLGGYAVVGQLAAKQLTMQGAALVGSASTIASTVQPIDILIVQAIFNTLTAHFISLIANLRLRTVADACAAAA